MNITQKEKTIHYKPHSKYRLNFKKINHFGAGMRQIYNFLRGDLILIKEGVS